MGTIVGVVIGGFIALFAFDAAFEVFHRLFFAGGTYLFDPRTDRLVQLFPFAFWDETTMALGAMIIVLALLVAFVAGRRARVAIARAHEPAAEAARADVQPRPGQEPVS
jgi:integral membrane protein (TIGR01906 family)